MIKPIPRRTFLRGASTCIALPFLESIAGPKARAQDSPAPRRLCIIYGANGVYHPAWYPSDGSNWNSKILEPMQAHSQNFTLVKGFYNRNADYRILDLGGGHGGASAAYLTSVRPRPIRPGIFPQAGISMDQVIAQEISASSSPTRFSSVQFLGRLGFEEDTARLPPIYTTSLVWSSPTTCMIMKTNPLKVFNDFFSDTSGVRKASDNDRDATLRRIYKKSILDSVLQSGRSLKDKLSQADKMRLEEYLTSIRSIETRLSNHIPIYTGASCPEHPPAPISEPGDEHYENNVKAILELSALAFQCDLTRVITIMLSNEVNNMNYPFLRNSSGKPILAGHHGMSHDLQTSADDVLHVNRWQMQMVADFLSRLTGIKEGDKTLLDNSLVVFGTGLRDAETHRYDNLPFLLAGSGGGTLPQAQIPRFKECPEQVPLANAWLRLMQMMMDRPPQTFGQYCDLENPQSDRPESTGAFDFSS